VVESTGVYSLAAERGKGFAGAGSRPAPRLFLRQNANLLETINFSAGHLYLPAQSDKVVTRVGIGTAASLPGRLVKRDNSRTHRPHVDLCAVEFRKRALAASHG
jgi:hypothetical protein